MNTFLNFLESFAWRDTGSFVWPKLYLTRTKQGGLINQTSTIKVVS
jgi:hypothetical protein